MYLGVEITGDGYRLGDGTNEYWWNGAAWEVNTTDWNTEAEVAANITSFLVTEKKIQVIVNLSTTDINETPELEAVKILWASDVEFQEDLVFRSLIPLFRSEIRPISDYPITFTSDTDTIDLINDFPLETPYNIVGIDSVFNHTDDPDHFTDLYQSFDVGTQVITLSSTVLTGKVVWIRFLWEPEVAVSTSQEYIEIERVPAIYITGITLLNSTRSGISDYVKNKGAGTAVIIKPPSQNDIELRVRGITATQRDQQRLADMFKRFLDNNPYLVSKALDEKYPIYQTSNYDMSSAIVQNEIYGGMISIKIVKALFYVEQDVDAYLVQRFVPTLTKLT